ncbi:T9SS type A sorting domain-containing protein [Hymenobacter aquaticus]|uniref:T9SS type A sorting domain-containing protein n=1 Tax=Hymenobacter aquaticus TaxID=1867101 RepID=UPI0014368B65|nr:T9SS type A sorting domain-containing protein [Hymenobacter aquaticus]
MATSLAHALNPDGTLRTGITGSFDAHDFTMSTAPDGRPVFHSASVAGAGDQFWQDGFALAGTNGRVNAIVASGSTVYIGGTFTAVGNTAARNIAKWDGTSWSALGGGTNGGTGVGVNALALAANGDLYVGGSFTFVGSLAANRIAKWSGNAWSALGAGVNSTVFALALDGADLYVGGSFTQAGGNPANRIARWSGSSWSALGVGTNDNVNALAVNPMGVYVGGRFSQAGGVAAGGVALWAGSTWLALGTGVNGEVKAVAVAGFAVYVGGGFTQAGGVEAKQVAKWENGAWLPLGGGIDGGGVFALAVQGTEVYAGGTFSQAGGAPVRRIAKWNGGAWSTVGSGIDEDKGGGDVFALAKNGPDLYAGGNFPAAGGVTAFSVAKWNGSVWSAVSPGNGGTIRAVAVSGTQVYVGGSFDRIGNIFTGCVAKWDGTTWSSVGGGLAMHPGFTGGVYHLAVSGATVYAGGSFQSPTASGSGLSNRVARWNGSTWSDLGDVSHINAMAAGPGGLYISGGIPVSSGVVAGGVFRWNGASWSSVGCLQGAGSAMVFIGPDLYVAGAGGPCLPACLVAKWDGSVWSALGAGSGSVLAMAASGSDLYVGGSFTSIAGVPANRVAKWNGSTWSALGGGANQTVRAIATHGANVYIGGSFTSVAASPVYDAVYVAKWNGSTWSSLGSGLNGSVEALAVGRDGEVCAGGNFTTVGGGSIFSPRETNKVSAFFGIYNEPQGPLATASPRRAVLGLYPNPAQASATLSLPAVAYSRQVQVIDGLGRVIRSVTLPAAASSLRLDLRELAAGIYTVRCDKATAQLVVE